MSNTRLTIEIARDRTVVQAVPCEYCGSPVGEACISDQSERRAAAATSHAVRYIAAAERGLVPDLRLKKENGDG